MKINKMDMFILFLGLILALLGIVLDYHPLSFAGGTFIGAFMYKLGYSWEASNE